MVKRPPRRLVPELRHLPIQEPFSTWYIDCLQALKTTTQGNKHVLVCVEAVTRYTVTAALKDLTAKTVTYALFSHLFAIHSYPKRIHTDNATYFHADFMKEMEKLTDTRHTFTLSYNSSANGYAERAIQVIQRALRCYTSTDQTDWDFYLPAVTFAKNTSVCRSNSSFADTPFFLYFGRDPRVPILNELGNASPLDINSTPTTTDTFKEHMFIQLHEAIQRCYRIHDEQHERYKAYYDRKATEIPLKVGDRVYITKPNLGRNKSRALTPGYVGPLRVIDLTPTTALVIPVLTPLNNNGSWVAIKRLKLVRQNYTPTYADHQAAMDFKESSEESDGIEDDPYAENIDDRSNNITPEWQAEDLPSNIDAPLETAAFNSETQGDRVDQPSPRTKEYLPRPTSYNLRRQPKPKRWKDFEYDQE
ncbi:hypothetical protein EB796_000066 [Bugula neritina]|uniref:Integrase catalytic domain-containing protein n=1 Tax=Bugula neritina TaxID=10212 RepID=A0A7J7KU60_BUGNE|nr:hypothetical protein EB796_000066 [Bugula neritina]